MPVKRNIYEKYRLSHSDLVLEEIGIKDFDKVLYLYKKAIGSPGCIWNENYPNEDIILEDIKSNDLYGFRNEAGEIIALIACDRDDNVDVLEFWNSDLTPARELSRLVIRQDYKNNGIARALILAIMDKLKEKGIKGIHFLVAVNNMQAMNSYKALGLNKAGEVDMYEAHYWCYEGDINEYIE